MRVVWGGLGVRAVVVATIVHGLVCLKMCLPSHDIVVSMFTIMFGVNPAHIMTHVHNNRTLFQKTTEVDQITPCCSLPTLPTKRAHSTFLDTQQREKERKESLTPQPLERKGFWFAKDGCHEAIYGRGLRSCATNCTGSATHDLELEQEVATSIRTKDVELLPPGHAKHHDGGVGAGACPKTTHKQHDRARVGTGACTISSAAHAQPELQ